MCQTASGSLSKLVCLLRPPVLLVLSLVLFGVGSAQVSSGSPPRKISKSDLKALEARAKTARDHREIGAYFVQQAEMLEKRSQEYEARCELVAEHPIKTKYSSTHDDCRFWSQYYALKSGEARNAANLHRQLANGLKETEEIIASKRKKEMIVLVVKDSGKLTAGENSVCVLVLNKRTQTPAAVQNVTIESTLGVGRNPLQLKAAQLSQKETGRYCGHEDRGEQYNSRANYYTVVRYSEATGKKQKLDFFVTVK